MSPIPTTLLWTPDQLGEGLARMGVAAGTSAPRSGTIAAALEVLPIAADGSLVSVTSQYDSLRECIAHSAPMALKVDGAETALLVLRANRRRAVVLGRDGLHHRIALSRLTELLETPLPPGLETTIELLGHRLRSRGLRLQDAFRREHRRNRPVFVGWKLAGPALQRLSDEFLGAPIVLRAAALAGVHIFHFSLWIISWLALVSALLGVGDRSALLSLWVLALVSSMLALPVESLLQQGLATRIGIAIKQHLITSALAMNEASVRTRGIGALIARALEANTLDTLAAKGGIKVLLTAFDFVIASGAFFWFAGLHPLLILFAATLTLSLLLCLSYHDAERRLHAANLAVTSVHTEEMIGHRTRKAFLGRNAWHEEEDGVLASYEHASARTDRIALLLGSIPRVWAAAGVAVVLIELFTRAAGASTLSSVVLIGFVIIGFATLQNASAGVMQLLKALVSFNFIDPSPRRNPHPADRSIARAPAPSHTGSRFTVKGLRFAYPGAPLPVVRNADLSVAPREKLLLSGTSGSGKSTLGALLAGRLEPDSGAVLSHGVDRHVVGTAGWHRYVCYVPQFSNNHVLTDTFAFNLLLGRSWPPTRDDLQAAYTVAASLGLDELIEKMPAGMMQMVGEGGWHLSQGERSRMFVARGILQGAHVLIADELLSPLDPATGLNVLDTLERLQSQVILIAHS